MSWPSKRERQRQRQFNTPPAGWEKLADYNAEVARGIVHEKWYDEEMAQRQADFNDWQSGLLK